MSVNQIGDGSPDGVQLPNTKAGFYGAIPVAQRPTTTYQYTSALGAVTTASTSQFGAAINAVSASLQEVMNTLQALGIWSIH